MLKSRNTFPAGGFVFFEPRTGWSSTPHIGFNETVTEIIRHRTANKGRFDWKTDRASVEQELEVYTVARLRSVRGGEQWITEGSPADSPPVFTNRPRRAVPGAGAAANVKRAVAGIGAVISWLGASLKPVEQSKANTRAEVCSVCPLNQQVEGIEKAMATAGDILHSIVEAKAQMKLVTPFDDKLKSCVACGCATATKVWAPIDHIKNGTTKEIFDALDSACWIRQELTGNEPLG